MTQLIIDRCRLLISVAIIVSNINKHLALERILAVNMGSEVKGLANPVSSVLSLFGKYSGSSCES